MKKIWLPIIIISFITLIDQLVKYWARTWLQLMGGQSTGIPYVFRFLYVENDGAAFNLFQNRRLFLVLANFAIITWLVCIVQTIPRTYAQLGIYFIIGGALGNVIDRMILGYVVDMIDLLFMNFAVFNIADCFVSVGVVILLFYYIFDDTEKKRVEIKRN